MSKDLSHIPKVEHDYGLSQWCQGTFTGIARNRPERTHTCDVGALMPGTIIFVHGVNSQGEWYKDAAGQFAEGLNGRLGRHDLEKLETDPIDKHRLKRKNNSNKNTRSPVIPFYWGYSVADEALFKVVEQRGGVAQVSNRDLEALKDKAHGVHKARDGDPDAGFVDAYGNYLEDEFAWGGGPFQNGTNNLLQFWEGGFRRHLLKGFVDLHEHSTLGRELFDCPERLYYVHAARRLALLIDTLRRDVVNEPINIVAHMQITLYRRAAQAANAAGFVWHPLRSVA